MRHQRRLLVPAAALFGASVAGLFTGLASILAFSALAAALLVFGLLRPRRQRSTRRLRFTRDGRYFVGLTLGVGFAAINTGNNLLYLVLGMMLSLIIVSGILSDLALRRLTADRELPHTVHAGRPYLTGITLHNPKTRLPSFSVQVEDLVDGHAVAKKCYFLKVPPNARQHTSYRGEFKHRGLYRYAGFQISTRFPFAFFVKSRQVDDRSELVVLPRILPVSALPEEARAVLGAVDRPRRGQGREFHGLRNYREGEDARDIHWKRSAREGRLLLREYESEGGRRIGLYLNNRVPESPAGEMFEDLEACVDLAASLIVHFSGRGFAIELVTPDDRLPVDADGRGLNAALRFLALMPFVQVDPDLLPSKRPPRQDTTWLLVNHRRAERLVDSRGFAHIFELG